MSEMIPRCSPLRFINVVNPINYYNRYPTIDNISLKTNYQRGINPAPVYPNFAKYFTISIEVFANTIRFAKIINLATNISTSITPVDITPSGWVSGNIWKINWRFTEIGFYKILLDADSKTLYSDDFEVKEWAADKDMVRIDFSDTENRNSGVFYNDTTKIWYPYMFYTGFIDSDSPQIESQVFNDEPNNTVNLLSTPKYIDKLTLTDIHVSYIRNITAQFTCDTLIVNGTEYAREGEIKVSGANNSDLKNVEITLSLKDNNGFQQFN